MKSNLSYNNFLSNTLSPAQSFLFSPISCLEIRQLLATLNKNKISTDIPNKLLCIASQPLSIPLAHIYNESISTGAVPNILKISRVTPIYKSGTTSDPSNYRPIAILSFAKILERLIYNQIHSFISKHNILYSYQFGFRKNHSTEHAILELSNQLKTNIDNGLVTCGIFLDLRKAFDTEIPHNTDKKIIPLWNKRESSRMV